MPKPQAEKYNDQVKQIAVLAKKNSQINNVHVSINCETIDLGYCIVADDYQTVKYVEIAICAFSVSQNRVPYHIQQLRS